MIEVFARGQYALHQESEDSSILKVFSLLPEKSQAELPNLQLVDVDHANKRCRWQISGRAEQLQADDTYALAWLALEFIFEKLQLKKVQVELVSHETMAIDFHRKLGFCEEGRLARHISRDDKFWDLILLAQFKENWDKRKKNLESILFEGSRV